VERAYSDENIHAEVPRGVIRLEGSLKPSGTAWKSFYVVSENPTKVWVACPGRRVR
jgi:hypothetical protein